MEGAHSRSFSTDRPPLARQSAWASIARENPGDQKILAVCAQQYTQAFQLERRKRFRDLFRIVRTFRAPTTGDRVLAGTIRGISVSRIRKIFEHENCRVDDIRSSDASDTVFIKFIYLEDGSHCTAVLTDRLEDGTYVRCCLTAHFSDALELSEINDLNLNSKFLKFYATPDGGLITEYSVLMIDLPDSSMAASIDMFHGAVRYIASSGFEY